MELRVNLELYKKFRGINIIGSLLMLKIMYNKIKRFLSSN
jgi:hypothetical protein